MSRLSLKHLSSAHAHVLRPSYDIESLSVGVVHFGPGAFHRAHQAAYFDAIASFDQRWGICGVSLHSKGVRDALEPQDGLYTLAILDEEIKYQVIGSVREILVAHEDVEAVFERLARESVGIVTSTVTEKGYCLTVAGSLDFNHPDIVHDLEHPKTPKSFIGYVVEGLKRRYALGSAPFVLIPCDNLPKNGVLLKAAVVAFAKKIDAALSQWIEDRLSCPCTMVDSITPATDDDLRARVATETGLEDQWPIQREAFTQWVIEEHEHENGPDWARAGVTITDNVPAFERAKIRLLNGPHSTLAYVGLGKGYQSVSEAMGDAKLSNFVRDLMMKDVIPLLEAPSGLNLVDYSEAILKRFKNPAIRHLLSQIAWDGSQKLPIRLISSLKEALKQGADIQRFAVPIAAWGRFIRQKALTGEAITDPLASKLISIGQELHDDVSDVQKILQIGEVFDAELVANPKVTDAISKAYDDLLQGKGMY